ncbi:MAG: KEOPS complex kinase/ATPase Bud32 [archaeon]|nr:KEOPS complex kinase/ATPase Bud32 [archaeon]
MKLLFQGAEASVFETSFFGEKCVLKKRESKAYRVKWLDEKIIAGRTRQECQLLSKAKSAQVRVPAIIFVDKKKGEIFLEHIGGKTAKNLPAKELEKICALIGKNVAKLHDAGMIHGDLTTANIAEEKNGLVFLDFGLGFFSDKIEDKATDLLVLKKTFAATHHKAKNAWKKTTESYIMNSLKGWQVIGHITEIEKRARYS